MNSLDGQNRTVLVCDTQPVAIEGVRGLLERSEGLRFIGGVSTLNAASELARMMTPSAVVIDKGFGLTGVLEWLRVANASGLSSAAVVWGSNMTEPEALRLMQGGARGVMRRTSDPETLVSCLRAVLSGTSFMEEGIFGTVERRGPGRSQLTPREVEVMRLAEKGLKNRDIANTLGIRTGTVKIHMRHIFEKTGVHGRYSLALTGMRERGDFAALPV